jgi:hypothetical protein
MVQKYDRIFSEVLMSNEDLIRDRMLKLDLTAHFVAQLSGVPETRLSLAFRKIRDLDRDQVLTVTSTLQEIQNLADDCAPLPISFVSPKIIREILEKKKKGDLLIDVRVVKAS